MLRNIVRMLLGHLPLNIRVIKGQLRICLRMLRKMRMLFRDPYTFLSLIGPTREMWSDP